jgi:hypothetical protein
MVNKVKLKQNRQQIPLSLDLKSKNNPPTRSNLFGCRGGSGLEILDLEKLDSPKEVVHQCVNTSLRSSRSSYKIRNSRYIRVKK